ncbi:hypothetical protein BVRB_7g179040 [Beta vulgaris subsp. vulgaris]|uniref:Uncharacterized protein n=1 Tax=Beta vulgaris subsp. vulgaris TaxID=3555 RepID=A0A0J8BAQ2_BETVV|nr:hypothetical protein BVRB_7g179040 [Beta vulgaris subsp. vulgaris]
MLSFYPQTVSPKIINSSRSKLLLPVTACAINLMAP